MCGIVGFSSRRHSAVSPLVNGLRRLEYRGYDSAGVALQSGEGIKVYKQTGKVAELENCVERAVLTAKDDVIRSYNLPEAMQDPAFAEDPFRPDVTMTLDEQLAATERRILENLSKGIQDKTIIWVTHHAVVQEYMSHSLAMQPQPHKRLNS